jgi:hypothetical protein
LPAVSHNRKTDGCGELGNLRGLYYSVWTDFIFGYVWFDVEGNREVNFISNASPQRDEKTIGRTQA